MSLRRTEKILAPQLCTTRHRSGTQPICRRIQYGWPGKRRLPGAMFALLCLLAGTISHAQVQPEDTSAAMLQIMAYDSAVLKSEIAYVAGTVRNMPADSLSVIYERIARRYENHSLPVPTLRYALEALHLAETSGNKSRLAWCLSFLGDFYTKQRNFPDALKYETHALEIFSALGDQHGVGSVYNGLGDVYENQGDYSKALQYYHAALNSLAGSKNKIDAQWPYYNIGEVYMYQGIYDSALIYFDHALAVQHDAGNTGSEAWTYNNIGITLGRQHAYAAAERYCKKSLAITTALNEPAGMRNAHKSLYNIYEATGYAARALEHYRAYTDLNAAISNKENTAAVIRLQMQYDFDKKQEVERLSAKEKQQGNLLAGLAMAGIAVGVLYFQRRDGRMKTALLQQNEEILQQKETLMKEIHHRVKNNLQVTTALLKMQLANISDETANSALRDSISRLDAIALIHLQLYSGNMTNEVEFWQFANGLFDHLNKAFGRSASRVAFHNNTPGTILDIDTAVPVGLILNELMTNSYKHAFGANDNAITISLEKRDGRYVLTYTDSGPGLPAVTPHNGKTMGMTIMHKLSRQVGGDMKCEPGSNVFIVTFRDAAEMKKTA